MLAIPDWLIFDIRTVIDELNKLEFATEFLIPQMDVIKIEWEGEAGKVIGEARRDPYDGKYVFWISDETLKSISEGEGG